MAPIQPVVERILARVRKSGDFPAMARTVGMISQLTSSAETTTSVLADTILQDYGLAQKILRIVNTVRYAQYDEVTTVSRAVLLLGFERIRTVATGLMLFEHLQSQAKTPALADALNMSFYSAFLARAITERTGFADPEQAFISSLFHNLGRTLVAFYLPQDMAHITPVGDEDPNAAARRVIGMSYSQIGMAVAEELRLPSRLADSMVRVTGAEAREGMSDAEKLGCVSTLTNDITDVLAAPGEGRQKRAEISRLVRSYGRSFETIDEKVDEVVAYALKSLREDSSTFRLDLPGSAFFNGLGEWRIASLVAGAGPQAAAEASAAGSLLAPNESGSAASRRPEDILTQGLHEITSLLLGGCTPDDVLRVALETMYRALGVGRSRVFFLLRDVAAPLARFRFGFGQTAAEMKSWFEVPVGGTEDIFGLAMRQHKDLVIKDVAASEVAAVVPEWFRPRVLPGRFVVLLPLVLDKKSVGLFYIDGEPETASVLTPAIVNYLKVLRGQAALAIQQSSRFRGRNP